MNTRTLFSLLAALAGPALAGHPSPHPEPGPARVAADFTPLIDAHRSAAAGSGLLPLPLAPTPRPARLCIPRRGADGAADGAVLHDRGSDARAARVRA